MTDRPTQPDPRRRDLAAIHIAAKQLGLDDDAYRALLREVAGVESARDLDAAGRRAVLARLGRSNVTSIRDWRTPRIAKARALWDALARAGVIRAPGEGAWLRFCARQTGVARPQWATSDGLNRLIEALKSWCDRERVPRDG